MTSCPGDGGGGHELGGERVEAGANKLSSERVEAGAGHGLREGQRRGAVAVLVTAAVGTNSAASGLRRERTNSAASGLRRERDTVSARDSDGAPLLSAKSSGVAGAA
ncbi:uncharacterized protein LOC132903658 [Amyelois transitella]|uniref:uncharacterized protein LOC132903658 n=1 Tax=Amyelois transitella TaxID=680683 RepID=UPI00298FE8AC|nr:uncharacterized protein LOC132903658 [Amyelois transitella]